MYNKEKMKQLLYEANHVDPMNDYAYFSKIKEIMTLLQSREDLNEFSQYMEHMTRDEYGILGSFIDEIDAKYVTRNFTEALKKLIKKYPLDLPKDYKDPQIEQVMLEAFEEELNRREKEATED
ncbi:hypothetical protein [Ligilactobacillus ceti]|uniref:Uncharacterized protein n=1 Tax=Ligilactobacillus ceti DSM 22408 TaxID=1122146 RepID=A0A0R2KLH9_9LACO|nr:hypothetical protein [Ligilactobacillus ceti]KRN88373.1 hypothetical protein IV53_GL000337 [Ligilactobacillus ceti DSM 22408]